MKSDINNSSLIDDSLKLGLQLRILLDDAVNAGGGKNRGNKNQSIVKTRSIEDGQLMILCGLGLAYIVKIEHQQSEYALTSKGLQFTLGPNYRTIIKKQQG